MKNYFTLSDGHSLNIKSFLSVFFLISGLSGLFAQEYTSLTGKLADQISNEAVPYANIALYSAPDSKLINGQMSDTNGYFKFSRVPAGSYRLLVSMVGYEQMSKEIKITDDSPYDAGILFLHESIISLEETVVTADRIRGKSEKDKATFFMTRKMIEASNNGLDIIKLVPGVQVDLRQNISLEGSQNILILVDGKERDKNYLSQINPNLIDKVEIMSAPPSKYDADVTGVINVVLKKEKNSGMGGQVNLEIPGSTSSFYIHPDYNFSLGFKKLNLYTSYNGEMIRFDQHESIHRNSSGIEGDVETRTDQYVRQKLWSHRFHYGFDYFLSPKSLFNFYAFYNPYSQEYNGLAEAGTNGNDKGQWQAVRVSSNFNKSTFYSLFFKHTFNDIGSDLTFDVSNYHLTGDIASTYTPGGSENGSGAINNNSKPGQNTFSFKVDGNVPLGQNMILSMGAKMRLQEMQDATVEDFRYTEQVYAAYGSLGFTGTKYDWNAGLRIENSVSELENNFHNPVLSLLPFATLNFKFSSDQNLKMALSRTIYRPNLYQLNPSISIDDPYTVRRGNPYLNPEIRTAVFMEYSKKFKSNFVSTRFFYNGNREVINNLTFINDTSAFETRIYNLGTIHQLGFQFIGTLKIGGLITFNPYIRLYGQYTKGNQLANEFSIADRYQLVIEPGFSAIVSFKHDFNLSMSCQYSSPRNNIQDNSFSDALYFISFEKTFKKCFKAGIVSVLPLKRTFTYQGSEIKDPDFNSCYKGEIHLQDFLVSFKLSYQFNAGKNHEKINRVKEIDAPPNKGF
jgi:outer membrane receptor for ferrienterochelin and colicin